MVNWLKQITLPAMTTSDIFAGDVMNWVVQYHDDIDLAAGDPNGIASIATETRFTSGKLVMWDLNKDHVIDFLVPNYSEDKTINLPSTLGSTDELVFEDAGATLTTKTISIDLNIINHSTTNAAGDILKGNGSFLQRLPRGSANQVLAVNSGGTDIAWVTSATGDVLTTASNTYGDFDQIFRSGRLDIRNPANTFSYSLTGSAIVANRAVTLPLLTADDTAVTEAFIQTITNKTINATNNTITDTSTAVGDLFKSNGTKFARMQRGSALQVLRTNSSGTDLEYATLDNERVGKSVASGNASTTIFNIAHGLGSNPTYAFISVAQSGTPPRDNSFTTDATNIVVTFATAPSSGTNNVVIYWRVVA